MIYSAVNWEINPVPTTIFSPLKEFEELGNRTSVRLVSRSLKRLFSFFHSNKDIGLIYWSSGTQWRFFQENLSFTEAHVNESSKNFPTLLQISN